jgi:hypothetical protein
MEAVVTTTMAVDIMFAVQVMPEVEVFADIAGVTAAATAVIAGKDRGTSSEVRGLSA